MKKLIILIAAVIIAGCQKTKEIQIPDSGGGGPDVKTMRVVEINTTNPVSGAKVVLDRCYQKNTNGNCFSYIVLGERLTNTEGQFIFPADFQVARMTAYHDDYWNGRIFNDNEYISMIPEGWVNLRVVREGRFTDDCKLILWKETNDPSLHEKDIITLSMIDLNPDGMNFAIRCFATVPDRIMWMITNYNGKEVLLQGSTPYFTIEKFQNLNFDLHYADNLPDGK